MVLPVGRLNFLFLLEVFLATLIKIAIYGIRISCEGFPCWTAACGRVIRSVGLIYISAFAWPHRGGVDLLEIAQDSREVFASLAGQGVLIAPRRVTSVL